MTPQEPEAKPSKPLGTRKPLSRRASITGALFALLVVAGVGGLAWYLTRPAAPGAAASGPSAGALGGPGGPGGPGGFGGGGRGGASTVGVATAEKASVPVVIDALGTVTPQATVKVRPLVSGVLEKLLFTEGQVVKAGQQLRQVLLDG